MNPKVSIIIPCYNQEKFLPNAIASLQAQTFVDWECIIVDDGSTDDSAIVAQTLESKDKRIRLIQKENGGSATARDAGLKAIKGAFVQFLDADDTISSEKLEKQVAFMESQQLDLSYTAFCSENSDGQRSKPKVVSLNLYKVLVDWGLDSSTPIHAFLYRSDFIQHHNLWYKSDCRYREDWKWHIQCFMANPKQTALPDLCGAIYYHNETSKTSSYIKIQEGNFAFMAYMGDVLYGWHKFLWLFRISEELWIWLLRMVKYRSTNIAKTITPLCTHTIVLLIAVLMMPISVFSIIKYFIKTYVVK